LIHFYKRKEIKNEKDLILNKTSRRKRSRKQ